MGLIGIGLFVFGNLLRGRNQRGKLTIYYDQERMAASVEINKHERAHAKREMFVLVVVVSVRWCCRKFGLEQNAGRGFHRGAYSAASNIQQQYGHPNLDSKHFGDPLFRADKFQARVAIMLG